MFKCLVYMPLIVILFSVQSGNCFVTGGVIFKEDKEVAVEQCKQKTQNKMQHENEETWCIHSCWLTSPDSKYACLPYFACKLPIVC